MRAGPLLAMLAALTTPVWAGDTAETPEPGGGKAVAAPEPKAAGSGSETASRPGDGQGRAAFGKGAGDGDAGALPPPPGPAPPITAAGIRAGAPGPTRLSPAGDAHATARALFHGGDSAVRVGVAGMPPSLPARRFPCANCHGADGMGGAEGARAVPPIVPVGRPALDAAAVLSSLTQGLGAGERSLDPLMPRYAIGPAEAEALAGFLAALPGRERQGVAPDRILLRLAPPPPAAPLADAFAAGFAEAVAGRQPWGRRIELAAGGGPAFAALGFGMRGDPDLPLVAPLGPARHDGPLRALCAAFEAEITALLGSLPPGAALQVMGKGELAAQARVLATAAGHGDAGAPAAVLLLDPAAAGAVPPGARVLGIAAQLHPPLAGRLARAGHRVTLSDGCAGVPGGGAAADAGPDRARQLGAVAGEAVWQALARSGRNLTRTRFLKALEQGQPSLSATGAVPVITNHPFHP